MATTVQDIIAGGRTRIAAVLAANSWTDARQIRWSFSLDRNSPEDLRQGYTIYPIQASTAETIAGYYTLDHTFEVVLSDGLGMIDDGDEHVFDVIEDLYDKADLVFRDLVNTQFGIPSQVMHVYEPAIEEPLLINDTEAVALVMSFDVKYRHSF